MPLKHTTKQTQAHTTNEHSGQSKLVISDRDTGIYDMKEMEIRGSVRWEEETERI